MKLKDYIDKLTGMVCVTGKSRRVLKSAYSVLKRRCYYLPERNLELGDLYSYVRGLVDRGKGCIVITQSPWIVSDFRKGNVVILGEGGIKQPEFETFGASVNLITMKLFGRVRTQGDYSGFILESFSDRLDRGEDVEGLIKEINNTMGDSIERVILLNKVINRRFE